MDPYNHLSNLWVQGERQTSIQEALSQLTFIVFCRPIKQQRVHIREWFLNHPSVQMSILFHNGLGVRVSDRTRILNNKSAALRPSTDNII